MSTNQQKKQAKDQEEQEHQQRDAVIAKHVMHILGQPDDLHRVQVRWLWENHYRVNVFIGDSAAFSRVANSYFLVADSAGNIIKSNPQITKQY